jgi:hypothetical protein
MHGAGRLWHRQTRSVFDLLQVLLFAGQHLLLNGSQEPTKRVGGAFRGTYIRSALFETILIQQWEVVKERHANADFQH